MARDLLLLRGLIVSLAVQSGWEGLQFANRSYATHLQWCQQAGKVEQCLAVAAGAQRHTVEDALPPPGIALTSLIKGPLTFISARQLSPVVWHC